MSRGGAGRGQGRKLVEPNAYRRIEIGARCEEVRKAASDEGIDARLDEVWNTSTLAEMRDRILAERKRYHDSINDLKRRGLVTTANIELSKFKAWEKRAEAELVKQAKAERGRKRSAFSLKRYRPKPLTRPEIYSIVSEEYGVSARRVRDYWTEYRTQILARSKV